MKEHDSGNRNSLDAILDSLDRKELVSIIKGHADMDEKIEAKIIAKYSVGDLTKNEYKKIISSVLNSSMRRGGFIPYNASSSACSGAESVLDKAEKLLEDGKIAQALTAAQAVLEKMVPVLQYADDSGGSIGGCIVSSLNIFRNASKRKLDGKTRKDFFNYLLKEWDNERYKGWDWGMQLIEMAIDVHAGQNEAGKMLAAIENCFENGIPNEIHKWHANTVYRLKHKALLKAGKTKDSEEFFNENLHRPDFRRVAIEEAFSNGNIDRVLELADSGIETDEKLAGLVHEWKKWKLKVYQARNEEDKIRELSLEFFQSGGTDNYDIYKATFREDEWPAEYERLTGYLYANLDRSYVAFSLLGFIFEKEKELGKLLELVKKSPHRISVYEKVLLPAYSEEVLGMLADNLRKEAEDSGARNEYWRLCNYGLKHLLEINGRDKALELTEEFRQKYTRRPAMLEEINKFMKKKDLL
jgi:hypothetical protein